MEVKNRRSMILALTPVVGDFSPYNWSLNYCLFPQSV